MNKSLKSVDITTNNEPYKPRDTTVIEPTKDEFYTSKQNKKITQRDIDNWICEYYNTYSEDLETIKCEQLVRKVFNFVRTKI
jgi:hypothetical protein